VKKYLIFLAAAMLCLAAACNQPSVEQKEELAEDYILIGFSQLGAESDWRSANTESMKSTFTAANGYELIFEDGQQKKSNQITAIRTFIQQEVDYIVLAPVTETGWDTVLQEAKDAGIPVIIVDRMVDVDDETLFTSWVGSNFELEGKKVTEWLHRYTEACGIQPEQINIVNIQGTIGASAQIGRTKALADAAKEHGWNLLAEMSGDFTQAKGREVMEYLLTEYDNINVVYCENDHEALGAIEAIEAAGKTVGSDIANGEIMVLAFDGINDEAVAYLKEGKITCIAECNPLHGPRVKAIIDQLEAGRVPGKLNFVEEGFFSADTTVSSLVIGGQVYGVTLVEKTEPVAETEVPEPEQEENPQE